MMGCPERKGNDDFVHIAVASDEDGYKSVNVLLMSNLKT